MAEILCVNRVTRPGRKYRGIIFACAAVLMFGASAQPSFGAARNVDITSSTAKDQANPNHRGTLTSPTGRLTATIYWHGKGPYRGHVIGHVHHLGGALANKCAVGQALEDGKVVDLRTVCNKRSAPVKHAFSNKGQVLVRVCGKTSERGTTRNCTDWK
jgi:hypothetical protein